MLLHVWISLIIFRIVCASLPLWIILGPFFWPFPNTVNYSQTYRPSKYIDSIWMYACTKETAMLLAWDHCDTLNVNMFSSMFFHGVLHIFMQTFIYSSYNKLNNRASHHDFLQFVGNGLKFKAAMNHGPLRYVWRIYVYCINTILKNISLHDDICGSFLKQGYHLNHPCQKNFPFW